MATSPYLAPSLAVLRAEINARWPHRDRTSDGWIGDAAHQASKSDHNPNARGSVDAIDVDNDGIDPYAVIEAFQRHPSAHYWIYQRQIADKDDGWRRRPYDGPSPHTEHVHFSIRQSATAEQDRRPWGLLEDDMPTVAEIWSAQFGPTGNRKTAGQLLAEARNSAADAVAHATQLEVTVAALTERVDQLTLAGVDLDQLAERVADKLAARLKE